MDDVDFGRVAGRFPGRAGHLTLNLTFRHFGFDTHQGDDGRLVERRSQ